MNDDSFTSILVHLGQSAVPVQALVTGFGYLLGIIFFMIGIQKLKIIADYRARSSSHLPMLVPVAYFLGGAALIYIPGAIKTASATAFGADNLLAYQKVNPFDVLGAMVIIIQTAGVIWFVRGISLLVNASNPGIQHGAKGFTFLIAGILALNFEATFSTIDTMFEYISSYTLAFKGSMGY
ncbi:type IV secretion protein IcmC [Legionella sp. W05-934-2]|jgi:hypothetical protein|uniref:type IV secretion protein IcmC n=1 Tax=Legionella sp. W05-934-2 TaxID=1198649 RepID=UPI003461D13E